jgi:uncharacterized protein (DUF2236 family)
MPLTDAIRRQIGAAVLERAVAPQGQERLKRPRPRVTEAERWFSADRPIRQVHSDSSMFVGGIAALLLQSVHPLAMAAVADHSGYRGDPWGRLQRTTHFIAATTFGTQAYATTAIAKVRAVHEHITGTAPDGRPYAASDPHLLRWVHVAEITAFLSAYAAYGSEPLDQAGRDGYVADMARIAIELGVPEPPRTEAEVAATLEEYRPELAGTPQAREAARFLMVKPPLPLMFRPVYASLAVAAVSLLPRWTRRELRLGSLPPAEAVLVRPAGRLAVKAIRWGLSAPR